MCACNVYISVQGNYPFLCLPSTVRSPRTSMSEICLYTVSVYAVFAGKVQRDILNPILHIENNL